MVPSGQNGPIGPRTIGPRTIELRPDGTRDLLIYVSAAPTLKLRVNYHPICETKGSAQSQ